LFSFYKLSLLAFPQTIFLTIFYPALPYYTFSRNDYKFISTSICYVWLCSTFAHYLWGCWQAKIEVALYFCGWFLHLQHICPVVLGDKAQRFWCQYGTPCCNTGSNSNLLHVQVHVLWLLWHICCNKLMIHLIVVITTWKVKCYIQLVSSELYFPLFEMPQMPYFLSCDGNRFSRAGSMVLALHDASDVFLEIGKLTKYCGSEIVPSISFLIFALSWLILRLIYFPFFIIWSTRYVISIAMQDGCLWLVCLSNIPAPCSLCKCFKYSFYSLSSAPRTIFEGVPLS